MTISLGQMPLKALASYLSVVEGFTKTEDRAIDTKYVAGVLSDLIAKAATDENGLRKIDDYYCVAMGTHYGKVGDKLYIETDEGACWKVILADIKSDKHTDSTNSYTLSNGCMMEFIVDTRQMPGPIKRSGTVNGLGFQGNITVVKKI